MATHSSIFSGEVHEHRSLAGYSPWSHKESDMTERLSLQAENNCTRRMQGSLESYQGGASLGTGSDQDGDQDWKHTLDATASPAEENLI